MTREKAAGGVTQATDHLPRKHKALNPKPRIQRERERERERI
jgi:hypothetical protein